tara:strand:+ start:33 stop:1424 length:1392 start_codon:yes stop_codon:yes gene_type:complete
MPLILSGNVATATAATGYNVANSCRFNDDDNPSLKKTPSGAGSLTNWTFSCWVKRSTISNAQQMIAMALAGSGNDTQINFSSGDQIEFFNRSGGSVNGMLLTNRKFRDVSAWYHIVAVWNSDDATAGNRMRLYINGTEETSFATDTNPDQNTESKFNSACEHVIGQANSGSADFDGYLAEVVYIDGQALTPSSFGEFNSDSPRIWQPVDVSGLTFGTNGFYLDFEDSSNLGNDIADNGDWTEANLAAADQATDTCTNNFCTMNTLIPTSNVTFSEGNCKIVSDASNPMTGAGVGTFGLTAGKWYYEVKIASLVDNHTHGAVSENTTELYTNVSAIQNDTGVTSWINGDGGEVVVDGTATTNDYGLYTDGQIMGVALDIDNYNITYLRNGSALVSDFNMSTTRGTIFPLIKTGVNTTSEVNFGGCSAFSLSSAQSDENGYGNFEHAPPSGYLAICSKNLGSDGG